MDINSVVAFDIGSTIIHPNFALLCQWLKNKTGIILEVEVVERAFCLAINGDIRQKPTDATLDQAEIFFASCGAQSELSSRQMRIFWEEIIESGGVNSWLYDLIDPEAKTTLSQLKSLGCYLIAASNSDGTLVEELDSYEISQFFDEIYDSEILKVEKPARSFYKKVLQAAPNAFSLHVGDDLVNDYIAPLYCGFNQALLYDRINLYPGIPMYAKISHLSEVVSKMEEFYDTQLER